MFLFAFGLSPHVGNLILIDQEICPLPCASRRLSATLSAAATSLQRRARFGCHATSFLEGFWTWAKQGDIGRDCLTVQASGPCLEFRRHYAIPN